MSALRTWNQFQYLFHNMRSYCTYASNIQDTADVERVYHDKRYGLRVEDDNELFGLLLLEINQAGLSWRTVMLREESLRKAYDGFDIRKIANYGDGDIDRLLADQSVIRNRLKVRAAIKNAKAILELRREFGSFRKWLDFYSEDLKYDKDAWVRVFKRHFTFVGGEIVREFLTGIGMFPGAHEKDCPLYRDMIK
jgi:DNA-3-methyladenine glycosylase I